MFLCCIPGFIIYKKVSSRFFFQLILELCCKQPDEQAIMSHLGRMRAPAALSSSSDYTVVNEILKLESHSTLYSLFYCSKQLLKHWHQRLDAITERNIKIKFKKLTFYLNKNDVTMFSAFLLITRSMMKKLFTWK